MKTYSSNQAAKKLGLATSTLSTYISVGKIDPPKSVTTGDITVYLWTDADIERVREILPKIANGRKTRHKKKGKTQTKKK
jgi:DNA-binding transcriptional MerR regulator